MLVITSVNFNQKSQDNVYPNKKQLQPTFGMDFTYATRRFLKKIAPKLVENEGFETAAGAIRQLGVLRRNPDGLMVKIGGEDFKYGEYSNTLDAFVKHGSIKSFLFVQSSGFSDSANHTSAEHLHNIAKYLSTRKFYKKAKGSIKSELLNPEKLSSYYLRKIRNKVADFTDNFFDKLSDVPFLVGNLIWNPRESINNLREYTLSRKALKVQIKMLKKLIDEQLA